MSTNHDADEPLGPKTRAALAQALREYRAGKVKSFTSVDALIADLRQPRPRRRASRRRSGGGR